MTTAQVVETSVTVNKNSPIQDYVYPDDQSQPTFIFTILSDHCKNTSKNIYVTFRDKNANNMAAFKAELQTT